MKNLCLRGPVAVLPLAVLATVSSHAHTVVPGELPVTVVSATRFTEALAPLPLGVSVITAEDIRASGATTVNEAVMRLLGIPGRQDPYGSGNYSLDLRGFGETASSNQVVVLDGIRLNEADLGSPRLSGIAIDTVERIEVLRGSGAVLYGEGATGGVIVITTKAGIGKERRNGASVYAGLGSNALRELRASATLATGAFSLDVSGQKRGTDNHRENFRAESDAAELSAQWSNDVLRLGVRYGRDSLDSRLPGSLSAVDYALNPIKTDFPDDFGLIRTDRTGIFAEAMLGDWQLAADVGQRDKHLEATQGGYWYGYDIDAIQTALRARHATRFGSVQNALTVGHDLGRWTRDSFSAYGGSRATQSNRAWYIKDDLTLAGGTRLSAGWRTEKFEKTSGDGADRLNDRLHAWELGVSQPLNAATRVWGRLGTSYRLANVDEFSYTNPAVAIRPQISRDLEAGARLAQGDYKLELRVYRSNITDEIGYDPQALGPGKFDGRNINFDPTRRTGLEIDGDWAVSRAFNMSVRAALRQSKFRSGPYAGNDVPLSPRRLVALRADWTPVAGHRISGGVSWVGPQKPDFANQCRMPSYTTADVRYAMTVANMELSFGVSNLLDRKYYTQAYRCSNGLTEGIYPEAGRTFNAGLRVSF